MALCQRHRELRLSVGYISTLRQRSPPSATSSRVERASPAERHAMRDILPPSTGRPAIALHLTLSAPRSRMVRDRSRIAGWRSLAPHGARRCGPGPAARERGWRMEVAAIDPLRRTS